MVTIENRQYIKETIVIDGNEYVDCTFTGCRMVYNGGEQPTFTNCSLKNSDLELGEAAANTTEYLQTLYQLGLRGGVERILDGVEKGDLPIGEPTRFPPSSHLGDNYSTLARGGAILAIIVGLLGAALWYGYVYYPENVVLDGDETRPLYNSRILDAVPVLPESLADIYDDIKANQIEESSRFESNADGTVKISLDEAINLIVETGIVSAPSTVGGE